MLGLYADDNQKIIREEEPRGRRVMTEIIASHKNSHTAPANTRRSPNVVSMLGRRRRQRANIETTLGQSFVGMYHRRIHKTHAVIVLGQCRIK